MRRFSVGAPVAAAVVVLAAVALAAPASASLVFDPPVNLSAAKASSPKVAFDRAGNGLVVWQRVFGGKFILESSFRPAGGAFRPSEILSNPDQNAVDAQVAFDGAGNALVVWLGSGAANDVVKASFRDAGGGFVSLPDVSAGSHAALNPQVAFDPYGNALVVWEESDGFNTRILGSFRPAGGVFQPTPSFLSAAGSDASRPQVAFDAVGNALAVWEHTVESLADPGVFNSIVQAAFRPAGVVFQAAGDLSAPGRDARVPQVAFDRAGNALAVWTRANSGGAQNSVQSSFRPAGGAFQSTPSDVSPFGNTEVGEPRIAFDEKGNALAVWRRSNGTNVLVQGAFRPVAGGFAPAIDVSAAGQDALAPQVAFDGSGNALTVWRNLNGVIQGAVRPGAGAFQTPFGLSEPGRLAVEPQVALDPSGRALVVWDRPDANGDTVVQAAFGGPAASGTLPPAIFPVFDPQGGRRDTTAPRVQGASVSPTTWGVSPQGRPEPAVTANVKLGTRFTYALSEPARVLFTIERASKGRKVRARCVRATRSNRNRKACTRYTKVGVFAQNGVGGTNTKKFSGRIGRKTLAPGRYRGTITATDAAGNRSAAKRLTFTVVRA